MNEQELKRKLAEFAGWKEGTCGWWYHPDNPSKPLSPTIFLKSLDACLKHLFPKLLSDNKLWGHFVEFARWEGLPPTRKRLKGGEMIKRLLNPMFICQTIEKIIAL